jgi:hypothetical protein
MITIRDICKARAAGDRIRLNELSLKRVLEFQTQSTSPTWAMVTADRLGATNEDRASRRSALCSLVQNLGYGISQLDGLWTRKPSDSTVNTMDSMFVQRVIFIHGVSLQQINRLMVCLGITKSLFGHSETSMAIVEPGGSIRSVGEVSPESITNIWGAHWCSGWIFEGFSLVPQGFIENVIESQFRRNVERMGLDQVIRDQDLQPSPAAP